MRSAVCSLVLKSFQVAKPMKFVFLLVLPNDLTVDLKKILGTVGPEPVYIPGGAGFLVHQQYHTTCFSLFHCWRIATAAKVNTLSMARQQMGFLTKSNHGRKELPEQIPTMYIYIYIFKYLATLQYFTNLDFPEIRDFPSKKLPFGVRKPCEVAII